MRLFTSTTTTIRPGDYVYAPFRDTYVEAQVTSVSGNYAIVTYNVPGMVNSRCFASAMRVKLDHLEKRR